MPASQRAPSASLRSRRRRTRLHAALGALVAGSTVLLAPPLRSSFALQSAPSLQCLPSPLAFGSVVLGGSPSNETITCTNTGRVRATVTAIQTTGGNAADFTPTTAPCMRTLSPGDSCPIPVAFAPGGVGPRTARLEITIAQSPAGPVTVELRGTGVARDSTLTFEPASLVFAERLGLTTSAAQSVTVTNIGSVPVTVAGATVEGSAPPDFALATSTCDGVTLPPAGTCAVSVTFTPQSPAARVGSLRVDHDGTGAPHLLPLAGTGATPAILVSPAIGRAGDVTSGVAVNFPPNQAVTLQWADPESATTAGFPEPLVIVTTTGDGSLVTPLLVFPKSPVGTRTLHAAVGPFVADGSFLVAPRSVQGPDFVGRA